MKTVNLEEICKDKFPSQYIDSRWSCTDVYWEDIFECMREACNQAIDLCADVQKDAYSELGLTNTAKKINELIIKTKSQIIC